MVDEGTVKRMLADQTEDAPDSKVLPKFGLNDLALESLKLYRNQFASLKPDHPFLTGDETDFLSKLGGWNRDRNTSEEGLTLAGLLMFGKYNSIREICPNYYVDYQERPLDGSNRWVDRVEPDGTWSGNLYDFYRRVILKLYDGLKVPFVLKNETRVDQTIVHEALREALVNTIIHADFLGRGSVLIVKSQGFFSFRNPGLMRIAIEDAIQGGITDARNRALQNMFKLIGAGEQAGSGVPKIFAAWKDQHWRCPLFIERHAAPETTTLEMKMISLFPQELLDQCKRQFGEGFNQLGELERLIIVITASEKEVTNTQLRYLTGTHPADITKALGYLVRGGYLVSHGPNRYKKYSLNFQLFKREVPTLAPNMSVITTSKSLSNELDLKLGSHKWQEVEAIAYEIKKTKRYPKENVKEVIIRILDLGFISLKDLAKAINRDRVSIQNHYLKMLMDEGNIELKYPETPNHPHQAYRKKRI